MKKIWLILLASTPLITRLNAQTFSQEVLAIWDDAVDARELGQYDLALVLHGLMLEKSLDNAELYNSRGKTYFDMAVSGKYNAQVDSLLQLAMADYSKGLRCTPVHDTIKSEILVNRGAAYGAQERMEEALRDIDEGLSIDPKNKNGYLNRSLIYINSGKYKEAIADHTHYLKFDPENASIFYERGMLYRVLKQNKKAVKDLNRAILLNPDLGIAYLERARAYAQMGNKVAAQQDYERAGQFSIKLEPMDVEMMGRH